MTSPDGAPHASHLGTRSLPFRPPPCPKGPGGDPKGSRGLGHERYCAEVVEQTTLLRAVVTSGVDLSTPVPTCPEWTLDQLVRHTGGAVNWVEALVRTQATEDIPCDRIPGCHGPAAAGPGALDDWLAETAEMTAETLRAAGPEADVWSWSPDRTAGFWARRMTHELAVHRADAALAAGLPYALAPEVAADALDEWLDVVRLPPCCGPAPAGPAPADAGRGADEGAGARGARDVVGGLPDTARSLYLYATDAPPELHAEWHVHVDDDGFAWRRGSQGLPRCPSPTTVRGVPAPEAVPGQDGANVSLCGPLADVLLAFYRRRSLDDPRVTVTGERDLLGHWLERASLG